MFLLKKIEGGARTNAPEPIELPRYSRTQVIEYGNLYYYTTGGVVVSRTALDSAEYPIVYLVIALENITAENRKANLKCFKVDSNMILEADVYGDLPSVCPGQGATITCNSEGTGIAIESTPSDEAIVRNIDKLYTHEKVYVQLIPENIIN